MANDEQPLPIRIIKLARRLMGLAPGRYSIILTVDKKPNWSVIRLGDVESLADEDDKQA